MFTEQEPTVTQGRRDTLFGSDIGHTECVRIEVSTASLDRNLSHDWIHSQKTVLQFEMSHAQFSQFITSQGNGGGTPVTLRWTQDEGPLPLIKKVETKHDTFRHEIRNSAKARLEKIEAKIRELGDLIESGKLPKKDLREIHSALLQSATDLPGSLDFVVKLAEEVLEKATSDAKIEVEAYIGSVAQRIGLKSINQLAQLEDKS